MTTEFAKDTHSRKKLAIVSTYNENCGNASYTHVLKTNFSKYVDVDVIGLDLFVLQNNTSTVRKAGDRHIKNIADQLRNYDYVNIQYEAGLYGANTSDMLRRLKILIDACRNVILTMHRVEYDRKPVLSALKVGISKRSYSRFRQARGMSRFADLTEAIAEYCNAARKKRNLSIKVHTRRDRRALQEVYEFQPAFDYPLAFLTEEEKAAAKSVVGREEFLRKSGFEPGDHVIGLFGYLSNYKGIETVIEALKYLPSHYKLGLFGSQHPQSVKRGEAVSPYLQSIFDLIDEIEEDNLNRARKAATVDWLHRRDGGERIRTNVTVAAPSDISNRIRFIGSLPDPEFIEALVLCDAVVLPYQEVGQSMSGVAVLAMEAGARMICSNNHSFFETNRYFKDCFVGFDMGNARELAQKIVHCVENPDLYRRSEEREAAFASFNIDNSVRQQLERFGHFKNQEQK